MLNDRNKKKEARRGDVVKNDKQAMKILGLLENTDKKEVDIRNKNLVSCFKFMSLDSSCECAIILSDGYSKGFPG